MSLGSGGGQVLFLDFIQVRFKSRNKTCPPRLRFLDAQSGQQAFSRRRRKASFLVGQVGSQLL